MSMTGAATSALSGNALAVDSTGNSCNSSGIYAYIAVTQTNGNWYDELQYIAVDGAQFTLAENGTKTLQVIGIYKGGKTGVIDNANLTFTSGTVATATVGAHTGVVTGVNDGTAQIHIVVTDKPAIDAYASVTVA